MLIQPVHKYWISSNMFIYRTCCFKYPPTILTLDWLYVSHFFLFNDCNIIVLLRSCTHNSDPLRDSPPLNIDIDDAHGHYFRCINTLRVCTFAISRKSFLCVFRHFQRQYLCENIFTVTGVSRSFAYTAGFQNTSPYDSLMALCNFC